ncbi:transglycosylase domain-containing protein [Shewanella intestini]|nr:transglycosylase domain-containing protein [Shewanella intestini]
MPETEPQTNFGNYRPPRVKPVKMKRSKVGLLLPILVLALGYFITFEVNHSFYQAKLLHYGASQLQTSLKPQATSMVRYPQYGPFDKRMGYVDLPLMLDKLQAQGYRITAQAQFSPQLMQYSKLGLFTPFREKAQAGLTIDDCSAKSQFNFAYPHDVYRDPNDIPSVIAASLLFIENRQLMKPQPYHNPVIDWPRFAKASVNQIATAFGMSATKGGGSTLATQIEKFRHSPHGQTRSIADKFTQLSSAMFRVYHHSETTYVARHLLVEDYLNSVPLSSAPGFGEVNGIGDGLNAWFGMSLTKVNDLLNQPHTLANSGKRGQAFKHVLALIIAQRRPSYYLLKGRNDLNLLVNRHLHLLAKQHIVPAELANAALKSQLVFTTAKFNPRRFLVNDTTSLPDSKGVNAIRVNTAQMLGVDLFHLDRLDLSVQSTLNQQLQQQVSAYLQGLSDPQQAKQAGIIGWRLLNEQQLKKVIYSFTLYESDGLQNYVRVQTDNNPQPFDINDGSKLELGSTAKLRVLMTYLDIVAELQQRFVTLTVNDLRKVDIERGDHITRWVVNYLIRTRDSNLAQMLDAALKRRYSASPKETFFTGGGEQKFNNFNHQEDKLTPTLYQALQGSINLPFVRLMRDIVSYSSSYNYQGSMAQLLHNDDDPNRENYLKAYAKREGGQFVRRFYHQYKGLSPQQRRKQFYATIAADKDSLSAAFRYLQPQANGQQLKDFLQTRLPTRFSDRQINRLYMKYGEGKFDLANLGYLVRVHPLELWVIKQLNLPYQGGAATTENHIKLQELTEQSQAQLIGVYRWLFKTRHQNARDVRIKVMLEVNAFLSIHQRWQKWGYPFNYLVPSLGSALGSSGDRPSALADLMGIIQNEGKMLAKSKVSNLHFAANTPYEVALQHLPQRAKQVLNPAIAKVLKRALTNVVEHGTARRIHATAIKELGDIAIGGKTGTGDNRIVTQLEHGRRIKSVAINRTATFVFYLGDHFFGTITAFVPGKQADDYHFTSSLPLQVLNGLLPLLSPYITKPDAMCQITSTK